MKKFLTIIYSVFLLSGFSHAQKGIGINGTIIENGSENPVGNQPVFIAVDSTAYPLVQNLHHQIFTHPDGTFSFYEPNIPPSSFPIKVLVYTFDCEYQRTGYEITYYYDNVMADSVIIDICTQSINPISIEIDTSNTSCPTYAHLENNGIRDWLYIYEDFIWYANGVEIGSGNEIDYLFDDSYNNITLKAVLKDSLTGFIIKDSLTTSNSAYFSQSYFHILAGNVFSGSIPVNSGTAILLRHCNSSFEHIDTLDFDTLGYYYFNNIPQCNYTVKIIDAIQGSSLPVIPTYLNDELHWTQCNHLNLVQDEFQKDINIYTAQNMSGQGYILGYITPQPNLIQDIILYNTSMEPLSSTTAFEDGIFEFGNLPYGTYILYSERYGTSSMTNTVVLDQNNPSTVVYMQQATGIEENSILSLNVFPNPATDKIFIDGNPIERVEIFDAQGRLIYKMKYNKNGIDIRKFDSGFYLIRGFDSEGNIYNAKFLKN